MIIFRKPNLSKNKLIINYEQNENKILKLYLASPLYAEYL